MHILSLEESNNIIIELIKKNKPFCISRVGLGSETNSTYIYKNTNDITNQYLLNIIPILHNNAGIYIDGDLNKLKIYCELYYDSVKQSDYLAAYTLDYYQRHQQFLSPLNKPALFSRILEPFYCFEENNIKPWSHYLIDKKVLIIHPFVESFKKQIENNFQIYKDPKKKIFLDGQSFQFYKTFNTSGFNKTHRDWLETYTEMSNDIKKIDFDIALLGCGGYGMPLCNFINKKLNKSAIYVGGGLQLLFGVFGKRWEEISMWKKIIKENECKFIRPANEEHAVNYKDIENGCYW